MISFHKEAVTIEIRLKFVMRQFEAMLQITIDTELKLDSKSITKGTLLIKNEKSSENLTAR